MPATGLGFGDVELNLLGIVFACLYRGVKLNWELDKQWFEDI